MQPEVIVTQSCGRCKQVLPSTDFAPSKRGRDGHYCRACRRDPSRAVEHKPRQCEYCKQLYIPKIVQGSPRFCSNTCSNRGNMRRHAATRTKRRELARAQNVCDTCGASLAHRRAGTKFCNDTCRAQFTRRWDNYRARKLNATIEPFTVDELHACWIANGINPDECFYCEGPHEHDDHYIPLSRGGDHCVENLVPACQFCNLSKKDKLAEEWLNPTWFGL